MFALVALGSSELRFDLSAPVDLAWPLHFLSHSGADLSTVAAAARNPDAFGLPAPRAEAIRFGDTVLETAQGASVNCHVLSVCPHGAGTHTECAAHIGVADLVVGDVAPRAPMLAQLIDVVARPRSESPDAHAGTTAPDDAFIDAQAIRNALVAWPDASASNDSPRALIVRTGVSDAAPPSFSGAGAAYFSTESVHAITAAGYTHLVTDLPSIDREDDGGTTPAHRAFFGASPRGTLTEMARLPATLVPDTYLLQFHLPPFVWESAPSRPVLFPRCPA